MAGRWRAAALLASIGFVALILSAGWLAAYGGTTQTKTVTVSPPVSTVTVTRTVNGTLVVTYTPPSDEVACDATSYNFPDTEEAFATETTYTVGNQTHSSAVITSVSSPSVTQVATSSYFTTTNQTGSAGLVVVSTSPSDGASACLPSGCWTVVTCTYLG